MLDAVIGSVVETQQGDVAQWRYPVIAPAGQRRRGEAGPLGDEPGETGNITAIQELTSLDLGLESGPACEAVFSSQSQLGRGKGDRAADGVNAAERVGVPRARGVVHVLRLQAQPVKIGAGRELM